MSSLETPIESLSAASSEILSMGLTSIEGDIDTNCMASFVPKHTTRVIYLDETGVLGVDQDDSQSVMLQISDH